MIGQLFSRIPSKKLITKQDGKKISVLTFVEELLSFLNKHQDSTDGYF
jgi:hypothetical protein